MNINIPKITSDTILNISLTVEELAVLYASVGVAPYDEMEDKMKEINGLTNRHSECISEELFETMGKTLKTIGFEDKTLKW